MGKIIKFRSSVRVTGATKQRKLEAQLRAEIADLKAQLAAKDAKIAELEDDLGAVVAYIEKL